MPIVPPAPVRFSMNTCWPSPRETYSPTSRATKSSPPPAANGTMKRTGRFGQSCARATCGANSAVAAMPLMKVRRRIPFMLFLCVELSNLPLVPIQDRRAIPCGDARPAQHTLEGAAHMIDPVRYAGKIGMHRDGHDLRALRRLRVE